MFPLSNVIGPATLQQVKNFPYADFFSKFFLFGSIVFNCMSRDSLTAPQVVYKGSSDDLRQKKLRCANLRCINYEF